MNGATLTCTLANGLDSSTGAVMWTKDRQYLPVQPGTLDLTVNMANYRRLMDIPDDR